MMRFSVDQRSIDSIFTEINTKLQGMKSLNTPYAKEQFAKAAFTILSKEFIRRTSVLANANPKVYHHIYEWGQTGNPAAKLFVLNKAGVSGGSLKINSQFIDSKKPVPIDPILRIPGKNGKIVTKTSVFRKKAEMMESGKPSRPFSAKTAKALAYVENGKIIFVKKPYTRTIKYPGGKSTIGAFNKQFYRWFGNPLTLNAAISKSGIIEQIEKNVARALQTKGAGSSAALRAMKQVTDAHSMGVVRL